MDSNKYQQASSHSSSSSETPAHPFGPITFWGWSTQHNLAYPDTNSNFSLRDEIINILQEYDWVDIYMLLVASRWNQYSGSAPGSLKLGTVSCTNHYGHINEPKERVSNAGVRTDNVRRIYLVDDTQPLPTGSNSWSIRPGCGVTNTVDIIYRYLKMGVESGPGGPCKTAQRLRELATVACNISNDGYTEIEIIPSDEDHSWPGHWNVIIADEKLLDEEFDDETKTIIDEGFMPVAQVYWVPDPRHCSGESDCACLLCQPYRD